MSAREMLTNLINSVPDSQMDLLYQAIGHFNQILNNRNDQYTIRNQHKKINPLIHKGCA